MRKLTKGLGAGINPNNRFDKLGYGRVHEEAIDLPPAEPARAEYLEVFPKTIVNRVTSPDVGMDYSLNPYQGCEHGCIYCYARNSHEYWGYSAGLDFERKVLVKKNAPELLRRHLDNPKWMPTAIALSGNTDCYQPIERKLEITRSLLEVFSRYRHPVGIITKNSLILRDLDILRELASQGLVKVILSITTLDEKLRRRMEPRTASVNRRLETVETLSRAGIPVGVMMAPVIPGLNSHEILPLVKEVANRGALQVGHTIVRLNGWIGDLFKDWLQRHYPGRSEKVLNQVAHAHGGSLRDSRFGTRMRGEGNYAEMINKTMALAKERFLRGRVFAEYNTSLFRRPENGQLSLWE